MDWYPAETATALAASARPITGAIVKHCYFVALYQPLTIVIRYFRSENRVAVSGDFTKSAFLNPFAYLTHLNRTHIIPVWLWHPRQNWGAVWNSSMDKKKLESFRKRLETR